MNIATTLYILITIVAGLAVFVGAFFYSKKYDVVIQPTIIAYATQIPFVLGLVGITYAILSSSWDVEVRFLIKALCISLVQFSSVQFSSVQFSSHQCYAELCIVVLDHFLVFCIHLPFHNLTLHTVIIVHHHY
jgi:Photosynthesis affected mutant 68